MALWSLYMLTVRPPEYPLFCDPHVVKEDSGLRQAKRRDEDGSRAKFRYSSSPGAAKQDRGFSSPRKDTSSWVGSIGEAPVNLLRKLSGL